MAKRKAPKRAKTVTCKVTIPASALKAAAAPKRRKSRKKRS